MLLCLFSVGHPTLPWPPGKVRDTAIYNDCHMVLPRDTLAKESARQVPGLVLDLLYLTAVFNSCVNPLIYGVYYYSESKAR